MNFTAFIFCSILKSHEVTFHFTCVSAIRVGGQRMQFQVCYLGYIEIQVVGSTILLEKASPVASLPFLLRDIGKMRNILREEEDSLENLIKVC